MFGLRFFKTIAILLAFIALIHRFALSSALYVLIPNLDTFLHGLAGFTLALMAVSLFEKMYDITVTMHYYLKLLIFVLVVVIVVAVGWEVFEKMIGFTSYLDVADTVTDLLAGVAGGLIGYGLYRFIQWGK